MVIGAQRKEIIFELFRKFFLNYHSLAWQVFIEVLLCAVYRGKKNEPDKHKHGFCQHTTFRTGGDRLKKADKLIPTTITSFKK